MFQSGQLLPQSTNVTFFGGRQETASGAINEASPAKLVVDHAMATIPSQALPSQHACFVGS